jgi:hypothetical protein
VSLYVRDYPVGSSTTKGPFSFTTTVTAKKDFRASGKIVAIKFQSTGGDVNWRLGKPLFDIVPMGER